MTQPLKISEMSVTAMTGSTFLPLGKVGDNIVGLTIIPTLFYADAKWSSARMVRGVPVQQRIAKLEAQPRRAQALKRARGRLAESMQSRNQGRSNLAALRMAAGLSQTELAVLMDTQQGNISRWERNPGDLMMASIIKMAKALGVLPIQVFEAIAQCSPEQVAS